MVAEPSPPDAPREVRLEGFRLLAGVLALGGVLLAAIAAAFLLGRWVERRSHPGSSAAEGLSDVRPAPYLDAEEGLTHFDRVGGPEQPREPAREIPQPGAGAAEDRLAPPAGEPPGEEGAFYVQVFAGRDRSSAEEIVGRLQRGGYRVRVVSEREGQDSLYKVRVGGYPSNERAREVMAELQRGGFPGAWVSRSD